MPKRLCFTPFAGVAWAIWRNRNKMAIEKVFVTSPDEVIHSAIHFLQMWTDLHKEKDRIKMKGMVQSLSDWMMKKEGYSGPCSDIVVF